MFHPALTATTISSPKTGADLACSLAFPIWTVFHVPDLPWDMHPDVLRDRLCHSNLRIVDAQALEGQHSAFDTLALELAKAVATDKPSRT